MFNYYCLSLIDFSLLVHPFIFNSNITTFINGNIFKFINK